MNVVYAPHAKPALPDPTGALSPQVARWVAVARLLAARRAGNFSRDVPSQDLGLLEDLVVRASVLRARVGFAQLRGPTPALGAAVQAMDLQLQQLGAHAQAIQASRLALAASDDREHRVQVLQRRMEVLQLDVGRVVAGRRHVLLRAARLTALQRELDRLLEDWSAVGTAPAEVLERRDACRVERMHALAQRTSTSPVVWLGQVRIALAALPELGLSLADEVIALLMEQPEHHDAMALVDEVLDRCLP